MEYEEMKNEGDMDERMIVIIKENDMQIEKKKGEMSEYMERIV